MGRLVHMVGVWVSSWFEDRIGWDGRAGPGWEVMIMIPLLFRLNVLLDGMEEETGWDVHWHFWVAYSIVFI